MAINNPVVTDSTWLQDTAVAIQNKDGGSKMEVPDFASRIAAIPTQDNALLNSLINRSITSIENSEVASIGVSAFRECTHLANVSFPNATRIENYAFNNCKELTNVSFPNAASIENYAFNNCKELTNVSFPNVTSIGIGAFYSCTNLMSVSLQNATNIGNSAFFNCTNLSIVILGKRATLSNSNAFGGADNAIIYVKPEDLSWYSTAANWSALYTAGRVKSIEDLTGDDLIWYQEQLAKYPIEEAS